MADHILSWMIFFPFLGVVVPPLLRHRRGQWICFFSSLGSSIFAMVAMFMMQRNVAHLQLEEVADWINTYAIQYRLGLDGMNVLLVALIAILFPTLIGCEWKRGRQNALSEQPHNSSEVGGIGIMGLLLVLQVSLLGAVCSQDLFLQFFFWSFNILPIYFLTGIWGGPEREQASFRTLIASLLGNALLFLGLVLLYYSVTPHSFNIKEISGSILSSGLVQPHPFLVHSPAPVVGLGNSFGLIIFGFFALGFCLRVPIWPLNGWFSQFADQAPMSVLVAFAAGIVPVACGLFTRICYFLFPQLLGSVALWISVLGLSNLIISALMSTGQKKYRGLLACVCLGQVGLTLVGMGSLSLAGLMGCLLQQLMAGLGFGALGIMFGVLAERTNQEGFQTSSGTKVIGGLLYQAPKLAFICAAAVCTVLAMPGSGNFIGQALILFGSYQQSPTFLVIASFMHIMVAAGVFQVYRSVFLGTPLGVSMGPVIDLSLREKVLVGGLLLALLLFGVYPKILVELIRPTALAVLTLVQGQK
jgi:NADH-quinone oxidoreductase subunit M